MSMPTGSLPFRQFVGALLGALILGAFSTLGDWIWARWIPDGAIVPGIVHGVLFFLLIAAVLGAAARSRRALGRLLAVLPAVGLVLAALFYPLAYVLGYAGSLVAVWAGMWLGLALAHRWALGAAESAGLALARGLVAAVTSGLAFWLVSGMWTAPAAETSYPFRLLYWTFAFLPGLVALLVGRVEEGAEEG